MSEIDLTIEICGMSGDGTIAAGGLLNAAMARAGLSLMAFDSYPAEIRGFGRCVTRTRIGNRSMMALGEKTQALVSLDDQQSFSRVPFLAEQALVLFDDGPQATLKEGQSLAAHVLPSHSLIGVPMGELAIASSGSRRGRNIVALGALAALFGMERTVFSGAIERKFKRKGEAVLRANLACLDAGYGYAVKNYRHHSMSSRFEATRQRVDEERRLMSGNEAICRGAIDAGVKLYFGYPITPATPIMEYLATALPAIGGSVVQMEDEISAIAAVLGSFYAGTRALTATSGPGFSLMTELITHGVMAEIPAVIVDAQRGGPATGLPTKTEQSDLHAAVYGGPGDSPRPVLAPTCVEECYHLTVAAFQLAEKYQTPIIILTDFFLNNRVETIFPLVAEPDRIKDGNIYPSVEDAGKYRRFRVTGDGISPRAIPGMEGYQFTTTGLEHTEAGVPDYSPGIHTLMTEKRFRKIHSALRDLPEPEEYFPGDELEVGIIAWGSTFGAAHEAAQRIRRGGHYVGVLKIITIYPLHQEMISSFMNRCRKILVPELNYQGQLATLLRGVTEKRIDQLNLVTGQPVTPDQVFGKLTELVRESENTQNG